jgi:RNA polymerase sigma-70 factor, ECF subfamily
MTGTDRELLALVLDGDKDAYRPIVERHTPTLFRVAYRITGNRSDAEEVVQESFLRAYQQLPRFELRSDFATWIYRITVNCALNLVQKEKTSRSRQADPGTEHLEAKLRDTQATPERLAESAQISGHRESAMKNLTDIERTAFILRHMEERSMDEVATVLGMTVNSAKQAVFRSVQKMRRALEPLWANR